MEHENNGRFDIKLTILSIERNGRRFNILRLLVYFVPFEKCFKNEGTIHRYAKIIRSKIVLIIVQL